MNIFNRFLYFTTMLVLSIQLNAQVTITVPNPSFERLIGGNGSVQGVTYNYWQWYKCNPDGTADMMAGDGLWGVDKPAQHLGYYGFMLATFPDTNQFESIAADLSTPFIPCVTYEFTVYLSNMKRGSGACALNGNSYENNYWDIEIELYGTNSCGFEELLWESGNITHCDWQQYTVTFSPSAAYTQIHWRPKMVDIYALGLPVGWYRMFAVGVDNMSDIVPLNTVINDTTINVQLCDGDSVFAAGAYQTLPGTYNDTLQTIAGCDSIVSTIVDITSGSINNSTLGLCNGDSVLIGGIYQSSPGIYIDTLQTINGCDSIVSTTLSFLPAYFTNVSIDLCEGDSIFLEGAYQTIGGTYYDTVQLSSSCDSITITTVNFISATPIVGADVTYCQGEAMMDLIATASAGGTLNWYDDAPLMNNIGTGTTLTPGTTVGVTVYYVTESFGACLSAPSMVTVTINSAPSITSEVATDVTDCLMPNGTVTVTVSGGNTFELFNAAGVTQSTNTTGIFTGLDQGDYYVVVSDGNCSTTGTTLTVGDQTAASSNTINAQVCSGDLYTFANGDTLTIIQATSVVSTFVNSVGCDSVITENVTILPALTSTYQATICEGDNYFSPNTGGGSFVNILQSFTLNTVVENGASNGCDSLVTEVITVIPAPTIDFGYDLTVCQGDPVTVTVTTGSGADAVWNTGDTTSSITFTATIDTMFIASDSMTCGIAYDTINISISTPPDVDAGPDVTIPLGLEVDLEAVSSVPGLTWEWIPGEYLSCSNCPDPTAGPTQTITYVVLGTDENGCIGYDSVRVIIDGEISIYIPNVFSPNNDGENDLFKVYGPEWKHYRMEVYDRWGGLIFLSEDPNNEWDGTHYKNGQLVPQAVFVYKFWGVSKIGMTFEKAGNVMISR